MTLYPDVPDSQLKSIQTEKCVHLSFQQFATKLIFRMDPTEITHCNGSLQHCRLLFFIYRHISKSPLSGEPNRSLPFPRYGHDTEATTSDHQTCKSYMN